MKLPSDGLILICQRGCSTCREIEPVFHQLAGSGARLSTYSQDDPGFPRDLPDVIDDSELEVSFHLAIETVPTLIRMEAGRETARIVGWDRAEWEAFTGVVGLGPGLPDWRPGCGSLSVEPGIPEKLAAKYGDSLRSRRVELAEAEDESEAAYARGWSDGLPVVPPTPERVLRMLGGTMRAPADIVGLIPPDYAECTVEKVAINAVLAGCKSEYMPVVLAAVEAAIQDDFAMQGVLATTYFSSPVVIVNGPITKRIGMNSGVNALGQGNRANATIGRALQLVIRNIGGGRPGEVDRAVLGNPGKYTFCFAESEETSPWESLAVERGFAPDESTVTLFAGDGVQAVMDQISRTPESLARSFAASLQTVCHAKVPLASDALLVVSPEHARVFREAGWSKARLKDELHAVLQIPGAELVRGAGGIAEGVPASRVQEVMPKFRPDGILIVHAGGTAGLFSAIVGGWPAAGRGGSQPVTVAVRE
ncbi:MAG: thioredoxin family protein [Anaerolineales bacterium]